MLLRSGKNTYNSAKRKPDTSAFNFSKALLCRKSAFNKMLFHCGPVQIFIGEIALINGSPGHSLGLVLCGPKP